MSEKKWKSLSGNFPPSIILEEGEPLECTLIKKRVTTVDDKERHLYTVEVDGDEKTLWGSGLLDHILKDVEEGSELRVTYIGKKPVKVGKKTFKMNQYKVDIAE